MSVTSADFKSAASANSATGQSRRRAPLSHISRQSVAHYSAAMMAISNRAPLAGITVVDLGRVLAAPFASSVLASLGARVIKVERPSTGDDARHFGPFIGDQSLYFASVNCGKESIALDLKSPTDRATFEGLLDLADVLVENFSPDVMESLGYGWSEVKSRWPRLVYASISGFGQTGPWSDRPAYDIIAQALSGMMHLTGTPGQGPVRVGASIGDLVGGLYLALGVVSALHKRHESGLGERVDVAMLDAQVAFLEVAMTKFTASGVEPQATGTRHPSIAPFQAFHCADRWIVIAAGNDQLFAKLCQALGRPDLASDARYATNDARRESIDALEGEMTATLSHHDAAHWIHVLGVAGVPCAPIQTVGEMTRMEQIAARNMVLPIDDPLLEGACVPGNPIKFSSSDDPTSRRRPPQLNEDRRRIIDEIASRERRSDY